MSAQGTDRDALLKPNEQWWRIGIDAFVAAIGEPPLTRDIDSLELLLLLQERPDHRSDGVHVRLAAGNLIISLASDVWERVKP